MTGLRARHAQEVIKDRTSRGGRPEVRYRRYAQASKPSRVERSLGPEYAPFASAASSPKVRPGFRVRMKVSPVSPSRISTSCPLRAAAFVLGNSRTSERVEIFMSHDLSNTGLGSSGEPHQARLLSSPRKTGHPVGQHATRIRNQQPVENVSADCGQDRTGA